MFNPLSSREIDIIISVIAFILAGILYKFMRKVFPHGRLLKCRDCGKEVSKSARSCPNCGGYYPALTLGSALTQIVLIFLITIGVTLILIG